MYLLKKYGDYTFEIRQKEREHQRLYGRKVSELTGNSMKEDETVQLIKNNRGNCALPGIIRDNIIRFIKDEIASKINGNRVNIEDNYTEPLEVEAFFVSGGIYIPLCPFFENDRYLNVIPDRDGGVAEMYLCDSLKDEVIYYEWVNWKTYVKDYFDGFFKKEESQSEEIKGRKEKEKPYFKKDVANLLGIALLSGTIGAIINKKKKG